MTKSRRASSSHPTKTRSLTKSQLAATIGGSKKIFVGGLGWDSPPPPPPPPKS